eukprot:6277043-Prymnesium_polylepis.2
MPPRSLKLIRSMVADMPGSAFIDQLFLRSAANRLVDVVDVFRADDGDELCFDDDRAREFAIVDDPRIDGVESVDILHLVRLTAHCSTSSTVCKLTNCSLDQRIARLERSTWAKQKALGKTPAIFSSATLPVAI